MITNWERSERPAELSDGESPDVHLLASSDDDADADAESAAVFSGLLEPTTLEKIRPWFRPTTYRFIPPPLSYIFIAGIPLVIPALSVAAGTFVYQRAASAIRVKRYLRHNKPDNNDGSYAREDNHDLHHQEEHLLGSYPAEKHDADDLAAYIPLILDER